MGTWAIRELYHPNREIPLHQTNLCPPKQLKCAAHAEASLDSVFVKPLWIYPALIRLIHPVGALLDKSCTFTTMHQFLPKQGCMVVQRGSEGGSLLFYLNCLNGGRATDVSR